MTAEPTSELPTCHESPVAPRTIAVTGATGFIGTRLLRRLLGAGFAVRALIRDHHPSRRFPAPGLDWIDGDLSDPASLGRLLAGAEAVAHCAGVVRGRTPADFEAVNVQGVTNLVRAARDFPTSPRLVVLSSLAAREPGLSPYAASKRGGEEVLARDADPRDWLVLRPPAVYGPGDREMLPLFKMMARGLVVIPGNPAARFSLLFVDDLAAAMVQALTGPAFPGGTCFELDDGRPGGYGWDEVAAIAARVLNRTQRRLVIPGPLLGLLGRLNGEAARLLNYRPMLTPGKVRELRHADWVCDHSAFSRATGWRPAIDFETGLAKTLGR